MLQLFKRVTNKSDTNYKKPALTRVQKPMLKMFFVPRELNLLLFWSSQKPLSNSDPLGDVGLHIGPTRGLSTDGNIYPQRRKEELDLWPQNEWVSTTHGGTFLRQVWWS